MIETIFNLFFGGENAKQRFDLLSQSDELVFLSLRLLTSILSIPKKKLF